MDSSGYTWSARPESGIALRGDGRIFFGAASECLVQAAAYLAPSAASLAPRLMARAEHTSDSGTRGTEHAGVRHPHGSVRHDA